MANPILFPMPSRRPRRNVSRTVQIEVGARSAWLHGTGLAALLDELGIPRMRDWVPERRGTLMCPVDRIDDLLAVLEHRDRRLVELTTVDR